MFEPLLSRPGARATFLFIAAGQMDIDGLGPETVDLMIREGFVSEPADLYRFDYERLLPYPGFGEKRSRR